MDNKTLTTDQPVLAHIQQLVEEEHRLFEQGERGIAGEMDRQKLAKVQVELDQCWDLLRQRRALREVGLDPNMAQVRPAQVVENYEQ
jgi:Protein of unknown function (DUF2630)